MNVRLNNISIKCLLAILLAGLFASCKDEIEEENVSRKPSHIAGKEISFVPYHDGFQKPTTRALVNSVADLDEVYVLSMKSEVGSDFWEQVFKDNLGKGLSVITLKNNGHVNDGEIWDYTESAPLADWEDDYSYKFRAYYPNSFNTTGGESCDGFKYDDAGGGLPNGSSTLTLENYVSATNPRDNTDLLVSNEETRVFSSSLDNSDVPVALKMNHLLSCINLKIENRKPSEKLTILGIRFKGYASEGNCEVSSSIKWNPNFDLETKYEDGTSVDRDDFTFRHYNNKGELVVFNPNAPGQLKKGEYIVTLKEEDNWESPTFEGATIEIDGGVLIKEEYQNLLFIPQQLNRGSANLSFVINKNTLKFTIEFKVVAEIEFYFGNDPNDKLTAIVDLTANGKVPEWLPGVKYTYNIGMYEYQSTVSIEIEDWTHHTYEEELK